MSELNVGLKVIVTGGKAPIEKADCVKQIAVNETVGSRVCDYVFHVYGGEFSIELSKLSDYDCGIKLNSMGFKAIPSAMFKDVIVGSSPLGEKYAKFYDETKGTKSGTTRKQDIVASGWNFLIGMVKPEIYDAKVIYLVDGRAMHKNMYEQYGSWEKYIEAGNIVK